jgi:hypothetical protein
LIGQSRIQIGYRQLNWQLAIRMATGESNRQLAIQNGQLPIGNPSIANLQSAVANP